MNLPIGSKLSAYRSVIEASDLGVSPEALHRRTTLVEPVAPKARLPNTSVADQRSLVEPTGIEPVTSCLQSTRSPS